MRLPLPRRARRARRRAEWMRQAAAETVGTVWRSVDGGLVLVTGNRRQQLLEPDGRAVRRDDYPELYEALKASHGNLREDADSFRIPDFRAHVVVNRHK